MTGEKTSTRKNKSSMITWLVTILFTGGAATAVISFLLPRIWPDNKPPQAKIAYLPSGGNAPLQVSFDGIKSSDPEGKKLIYEWAINGSVVSNEISFSRYFSMPARYHITLKVVDNGGLQNSDGVWIDVASPPERSPEPPSRGSSPPEQHSGNGTAHVKTDISGTYSGLVIEHISDNIYKLESPPGTWQWVGCGIYWNNKIFGAGRFTNEKTPGRAFMTHMTVNGQKIIFNGVYLTTDQGDVMDLPPSIRVDRHVLTTSEPRTDISGIYSGHIIAKISDNIYKLESPPGTWHWSGCGIYWDNKIFGAGRFTNEKTPGRAFMVHMEINGPTIIFKGIYLTEDQGNLLTLPSGIRVDRHELNKE